MPMYVSSCSPMVSLSVFTNMPYTPSNAAATDDRSLVFPAKERLRDQGVSRGKNRSNTFDNLYALAAQPIGARAVRIARQRSDGVRRGRAVRRLSEEAVHDSQALSAGGAYDENDLFGHIREVKADN